MVCNWTHWYLNLIAQYQRTIRLSLSKKATSTACAGFTGIAKFPNTSFVENITNKTLHHSIVSFKSTEKKVEEEAVSKPMNFFIAISAFIVIFGLFVTISQ